MTTGHDRRSRAVPKDRDPADRNTAAGLLTTAADYATFMAAVIRGTGLERKTGKALVYFINSEAGLSIARAVVSGVFPDEHAALAWLDDDTYDAPQRVARRTIETALFEGGADSGLQAYDEMRMLATLGRARLEAGDGAGALAAYQQALERVPNHPIIGKEFAWLEETVDGQAAAPALTVAELER